MRRLVTLLAVTILIASGSAAFSAVLYQDDFSGYDASSRYSSDYGGTPWLDAFWFSTSPSTTANHGYSAPVGVNYVHTNSYAGGNFTNTHFTVTYDQLVLPPLYAQGQYVTVLFNGYVAANKQAGYKVGFEIDSNGMYLAIARVDLDGSVHWLSSPLFYDGDYNFDQYRKASVKVEADARVDGTYLAVTWNGLDKSGNPISCTTDYLDTSSERYTSGNGIGLFQNSYINGIAADNLIVKDVTNAVIYQDDFEADDAAQRYVIDSGSFAQVAYGDGLIKSDDGGLSAVHTSAFAGGDFTNSSYKVKFDILSKDPAYSWIAPCFLYNGLAGGGSYRQVGYSVKICANATGKLSYEFLRHNADGTTDWPWYNDDTTGFPADFSKWATVTAEVQARASETQLNMTWSGFSGNPSVPVSYTVSLIDDSAKRISSGNGLGFLGYNGNSGATGGFVLDNLKVETTSIATPTPTSIADAKNSNDGTHVYIKGANVSACLFTDGYTPIGFGIEDVDRTNAIRVVSATQPTVGKKVNIDGVVNTVSGERVIVAERVEFYVGGNGDVVKPVGLSNKATAGGSTSKQSAVVDSAPSTMATGTNNVGMLVTTWGKVTYVNNDWWMHSYFYIDDGSGIWDGTVNLGVPVKGVRCRVYPIGSELCPALDDYVAVTGIMGVQQVDGVNARFIWTTDWSRKN